MNIRTPYTLALTLLASLWLSACANQADNSQWLNSNSVDYLTPGSSQAVQFAQPGQVVSINTQGRNQFKAKVVKRYFAASGRHCLRLQAINEQYIACDYSATAGGNSGQTDAVRWGLTPAYARSSAANPEGIGQ
ncbi:MAG: hypothetical protein CMF12_06785 [Idiomarina sp.]|uniref:hypothetical protein n=1 Tax=Idiomarina sp. TaxID=1874361 RepID=UPI000C37621A|nr:hypothetical protein [Idiomarina sp.]MBT42215.1 hypothetical protein [Idiomarina sp.]